MEAFKALEMNIISKFWVQKHCSCIVTQNSKAAHPVTYFPHVRANNIKISPLVRKSIIYLLCFSDCYHLQLQMTIHQMEDFIKLHELWIFKRHVTDHSIEWFFKNLPNTAYHFKQFETWCYYLLKDCEISFAKTM